MGARCDECPLQGHRVVPPETASRAVVAVVGEAPGFHEEQQGVPFIGRSGRLLDDVLMRTGLQRGRVHVTNAVLCRPPDGSGEDVLKKAARACAPRLARELDELECLRVTLPVGRVAAEAAGTHRVGIQRVRGFVWPAHVRVEVPKPGRVKNGNGEGTRTYMHEIRGVVVPSVHPAFVLRSPGWEPVLRTDFSRAAEIAKSEFHAPGHEKHVAPAEREIGGLLARLGSTIAIDVETTDVDPMSCALLCIGVSDGARTVVVPWGANPRANRRAALLVQTAIQTRRVVTHNGHAFDAIVLGRYGIRLDSAAEWDDTLLAHHTFASGFPQRLDHVVSMYLGVRPWKLEYRARPDERGSWHAANLRDLWDYNALDAQYTALAWRAMAGDLAPEQGVYETDKCMASLCRRMREHGILIDDKAQRRAERELRGRQNWLTGRLRAIAQRPTLRPSNQQDVGDALFTRLGAHAVYYTPKRRLRATSRQVLQILAAAPTGYGEFCRVLLQYRETRKLLSTYVCGIVPGEDGRVHPEWRAWGTATGRLSARDPNLMNLPSRDRKALTLVQSFFVSPRGRVFVKFDVSRAEMRLAAYLSEDPRFMKSCEAQDIHLANAAAIFGELPADETERTRLRVLAKSVGFAMNYGAGAEKVQAFLLGQGISIGLAQVVAMLGKLRRAYPRYFEWQDENLRQVRNAGHMRTFLCGRLRWFGPVPEPSEVMNYPIQGGIADIMNTRLPELEDALPRGAGLVAQIHDAAVIECARGAASRVARACRHVFTRPVEIHGREVVFPIEVKIGRTLAEVA